MFKLKRETFSLVVVTCYLLPLVSFEYLYIPRLRLKGVVGGFPGSPLIWTKVQILFSLPPLVTKSPTHILGDMTHGEVMWLCAEGSQLKQRVFVSW